MLTIFTKNILLIKIIFILLLSNNSFPQSSLYIPLNIKKAYDKETRSYDGKTGPKYWQNRSDYKIEVRIEPETRMLHGKETIKYFNNSPNKLKYIVINLYQDLNKYGNIRMRSLRKEALSDGVNIENIEINGAKVGNWKQQRYGTNLFLYLPESLQTGDNITFYIEWNFIIPKGSNIRMGTYGPSTFMVAYWYPQISVYDDVDGWDRIDYTGEQEFYSDYSNYDVSVTVPNNVCVWATGVLQNPEDVMTTKYYERYNKALESNTVINIINKEDLAKGNIFNQETKYNIWHYKAENVTDFAFAMSGSYLWDAVSLRVEEGRNVLISAAYNPDSQDFYEVAEISRVTIDMLSNDFPAVPFPYPRFTVFNGSGGMEYPMMANDGTRYSKSSTVNVTSHEISHTYFPFYVGTNEKKYAWMDEGWAQVLPIKIQDSLAEGNDQAYRNVSRYLFNAGGEMEMPMMTPSNLLTYPTLGTASYFRPAVAYLILRDILGEEVFGNALREYIDRWKGKHPMPYDFFFTFNDVTGENLDWFWKLWFFERGYPDLAIKDVMHTGSKVKIIVERVGLLPIPIELKLIADDFSEIIIHNDASIWKNGDKEIIIKKDTNKKIIKVELGSILIPDVNKKNNVFKTIY
jgi:hypothetical protein